MRTEVKSCRICGNTALDPILELGEQCLTGRFPKSATESVPSIPLVLVKCRETEGAKTCGLVQLRYSAELGEMYGEGYGYHSGLNASMVAHLKSIVDRIEETLTLQAGDLVIDIGSNDATTLKHYRTRGLMRTGVDPTGTFFKRFYPPDIQLIPDFFTAAAVKALHGGKQARVVSSIAMFYDLPDPMKFVQDVYDVLAPGGIWVFEQSYMPSMMARDSYDTVCHEHLEYYGLRQVKWMTDRVGFNLNHVELTEANGGSFLVIAEKPAVKNASGVTQPRGTAAKLLEQEREQRLDTLAPYQAFAERTIRHRDEIKRFFAQARAEGRVVFGYGASTKGNVLLQYCGITPEDMPYVAEVNSSKFGSFTPGTRIPIISEAEARSRKPDYFFVLPWHFRDSILEREAEYRRTGAKFVFPLPTLQVI